MIDFSEIFSQNGDRKVKVEIDFAKKIRKFFGGFLQGIKNNKVLNKLKEQGVTIMSLFKKKQTIQEVEEKDKQPDNKTVTNDKIDIPEEAKKPIQAIFTLDKETDMHNKKVNIMPELEDTIPTTETDTKESDKEELSVQLEADEKVKEILECVKNDDRERFIQIINEEGYRKMADLVYDNFNSGKISEAENTMFVDMKNELYDENGELIQETEKNEIDKEPVVEEPILEKSVESNGIDITNIIKTTNINLNDLTQFEDYIDYVLAYKEKNIAAKDSDKFWTDFHKQNLPTDLLDEKEFIEERRRQEEQKIQREIELKLAETEKKLSEVRGQLSATERKANTLASNNKENEAALKNATQDKILLEQQMVDAKSEIADLERENSSLNNQLSVAQEVAKKAQARSYEDRKTLSTMEKEIDKLKKHAAELEKELATSKQESAEVRKELEATKARIRENANAALERIESLRTPEDDDIEKTALDWAKTKIEENLPKEHVVETSKSIEKQKEESDETEEKKTDDSTKTIVAPTPVENPKPDHEETITETQKKIDELQKVKNQTLVDAIIAEAGGQAVEEQSPKTR